MGGAEQCPHALLVPSMGQGHVSACMLLARSLAAFGFKVTFVYFSSSYAQLKASNHLVLPYSSHTADGHDLHAFQNIAPSSHCSHGNGSVANGGTDASSHQAITMASIGNSRHCMCLIEIRVVEDAFEPGDINKLFFVTPAMKENLFDLIVELREQGTPPTCLISDSFVPWTVHVAQRAGIPRIDFWTSNAMSYVMLTNHSVLFAQGIFPEKESSAKWRRETPLLLDHIPGLPPFSSEFYPRKLRFADPSHPAVSFLTEVSSCGRYGERILIHTMSEVEVDAFQALQVAGIPAYGIGPLLHYAEQQQEGTLALSQAQEKSTVSQHNEQVDCTAWLNTQADHSVLYVAFGSLASLSTEEIQELALGLEASGFPFLWVIRQDSHGGAELPQVLPQGFHERTSERGVIVGWAPQVEVLAHKAIAGFLTHCGWNSTVESLWEGVPLLCCPRFAEQRLNAHYLCNVWGVGVELGRTDMGGLERGLVKLGVKALMEEEEGFKAREKAQQMMELARKTCQPGGQSYSNLQKFYDDMKVLCSQPTSHTPST